jgi:hypothetical protein
MQRGCKARSTRWHIVSLIVDATMVVTLTNSSSASKMIDAAMHRYVVVGRWFAPREVLAMLKLLTDSSRMSAKRPFLVRQL